ncbi:MAG: hypothetical protein O2816_09790 [Planctomycetota bacterium]|nr:hypothetical protein [Planctomycetota bacterium]
MFVEERDRPARAERYSDTDRRRGAELRAGLLRLKRFKTLLTLLLVLDVLGLFVTAAILTVAQNTDHDISGFLWIGFAHGIGVTITVAAARQVVLRKPVTTARLLIGLHALGAVFGLLVGDGYVFNLFALLILGLVHAEATKVQRLALQNPDHVLARRMRGEKIAQPKASRRR